ncbi:Dyp-type peroxidase family protein [Alcanivorax sp. S71-1-4]|uniref:Dyp-type peroxidase n=1 Tax=Alcanivorax sp. S71-1-4 TaxID=1177159 RepID=UPI0013575F96|nr:Dyp-type peroxidase [Alcanivorax sp. S71-1-4]KAF0806949.1 Dyp-type peroxidase family protein [Alcanivorax sp. S71-1-4]
MSSFQPGIFDKRFRDQVFLEYLMEDSDKARQTVKALLTLRAQYQDNAVITVAFGPALWRQLDGQVDFEAFSLDGRVPATQADLLVWVQAADRSHAFDVARAAHLTVSQAFRQQLEIDAFVYHDLRDLTGFVDGIGNPVGDKARLAALVPDGQPGAGGSFVLTQKWVHNLAAFEQLPVSEQENVFGRTKADAVEFDEERMPNDSHVGRTDVDRDGVPQKIWRRSVPYGGTLEHGSYFVAFCCEQSRLDYLLRRMFALNDDKVQDRLTQFSTPVNSSYWYAPPEEALAAM